LSAPASWGTPPWDPGPPRAPVTPPHACDAAVIGGGLTGLSAAYHLARRGCATVVLEAQRIGAGASGRTGAIALEGTAMGVLDETGTCLETLARVVRAASIACDLELGGCWELAHRAPGPTDVLLWPDGDVPLCVTRTEPGGTLDAGALLAGLARAATAAGAVIVEQAPVRPLHRGRPLDLGGRTLDARHVVVATEGLTGALVPLPDDVSAALTLAAATTPLDGPRLDAIGLADRRPFYTVDMPYLWGRTLRCGRIVFGAGLVFPDDGDVRGVSIDSTAAVAAFGRLEERVRGFHPALRGVGIDARWGGPVAFRRARSPLCGWHPDLPGVVVTGAYAGHGVALSVRIGALVADAIADARALPGWGALTA